MSTGAPEYNLALGPHFSLHGPVQTQLEVEGLQGCLWLQPYMTHEIHTHDAQSIATMEGLGWLGIYPNPSCQHSLWEHTHDIRQSVD